jgi:DNA-binding CsgD family transcriptional regulator
MWRRAAELVGRRAECAVLDQLIGAVHAGSSVALVVHGEPGVGKTALLDYVAVQSLGFRVLRASGVQSEMELPYAGLHQLCAPLLDRLTLLPEPQQQALRTAFGISSGPAPERFLVGLAALGLLSEAAEQQPVMCLVDDYQWHDRASAGVLTFVARRLGAESLGLIVASRVIGDDLERLPELAVDGLSATDAGDLLDTVLSGPVDTRVRDQIIAETGGNPLALLELPRGLSPTQLAGGFGLPGVVALSNSIEERFGGRIRAVPPATRTLLLIAASDPSGDPTLLWRAAAGLGIGADAAGPIAETGLMELGTRVQFRHPLARSAIYRAASEQDRQQAHRALAEATDPQLDPDRQAWHRAQATVGPDEHVAAGLERSAARAQARGGFAAAAAFLRRAVEFTLDPATRATRALAAAESHTKAGAFEPVPELLSIARSAPLDEFHRAKVDLIGAQLAFATRRGSDGPPLLLKAATRLEQVDADRARATYLDALAAATFVGRSAIPTGDLSQIARAAGAAPPPTRVRPLDLLLDGTVAALNHGYAAGLPILRSALTEYGSGMSPEDELHWMWFASTTAIRTWDDQHLDTLSIRHIHLARDLGALSELPLALNVRALLLLLFGELAEAARLIGEADEVAAATGTALAPYGAWGLAAFRGDASVGTALHQQAVPDVVRRGEGAGITFAEWASAVLHNGLGRYHDALAAAERAVHFDAGAVAMLWPYGELVEAAVRTGDTDRARRACDRLADTTNSSGTDWALGLQTRCQAMVSTGSQAETLYRESINRFDRTRLRVDGARARLLYGEWLRRERRHNDAREQLRAAHTTLEALGAEGFAQRAARELRVAGGTVRKRIDADKRDDLTAQETQIAQMASDGLSNPEIGAQLFISARTVQYHLKKIFIKLAVTSRSQITTALLHNEDIPPH